MRACARVCRSTRDTRVLARPSRSPPHAAGTTSSQPPQFHEPRISASVKLSSFSINPADQSRMHQRSVNPTAAPGHLNAAPADANALHSGGVDCRRRTGRPAHPHLAA
jgi:hypothetical protein